MTYKLVSYEYFMDDLKDWELGVLIDNISWSTKNEWEQARMIMYASLMPYMKKSSIKDVTDILPLPTDRDSKVNISKYQDHDYNVSNEQIDRLKQKASQLEKIFKEKKKNG